MDLDKISFRYDKNIPNAREGQSFYSFNGTDFSKKIIDSGNENFVPENSFLNFEKSLNIISEFFANSLKLPTSIQWNNGNDFDWENIY